MARHSELQPAGSPHVTSGSTLAAVAPLLLLILIDASGFAMLAPLLATALAGGSDAAIQEGLSSTERHLVYGVAIGFYPLMNFFSAPILGQLSDRFGRKTILLVCASGIVASYGVTCAAFAWGSILLLMAGRFIGGMTSASHAVSLAAVIDVCPPEHKGFWLSMALLCSSLGFVLGPAVGGLLSDSQIVPWFSILTPLYVTALITAVNVVLLILLFHDRRQRLTSSPVSLVSGFRSFGLAFARPGALRDVSWVFLLQELAWGAYFYFIPVFLLERFAAGAQQTNFFMSVMGIGFCLSYAVAMPLLTRYFATRAIAQWSLCATASLIAVSWLGPSILVQWAVILPISVATAVSYGALMTLFTDTVTDGNNGEVMGITVAINCISFGTVSLIGGALEGLSAGGPIFVALALMTASWLLLSLQKSKHATGQGPRS